MQLRISFEDALLRQRGDLLLWCPVAFGCGIVAYFSVPVEPGLAVMAAIGVLAAGMLAINHTARESVAPLASFVAIMAIGFLWIALRSHMVAAPVLKWRYVGPVEGRIVAIDRSGGNAPRLLLEDLALPGVRARDLPARVRVSLHDGAASVPVRIGQRVSLSAKLSPPSMSAEPGGFQFQRHAWFQRLGGTGYSSDPPRITAPSDAGPMARLRERVTRALHSRIGGTAGGVAAAITTGDRSGVPRHVMDDLRRSNLAHLLAISGLHMGLLSAIFFGAVRAVLAAIQPIALRWPTKKIAACAAIIAAFGYLMMSGQAIASERAFVMVTVALGAVIVDRRVLTLRGVAVAAMIVLLRRPEAIISPGFQMSFSATIGLVVAFTHLQGGIGRRAVVSLFVASLVAGVATAPFAAAHFNILSRYGLIANLLSVPVMSGLVMPMAALASVLAMIGAEAPALWAMGVGLDWILGIAHWVAQMPGAVSPVASPHGAAFAAIVLGAVWAALWSGRAAWAGWGVVCVGLMMWPLARRPDVLIASSGGLVGVMTDAGRALSKPTGDRFSAQVWLENDGDSASQSGAAARAGWVADGRYKRSHVGGWDILLATGRKTVAGLDGCGGADILIVNVRDRQDRPCRHYDKTSLARTGAVSLTLRPGHITERTAQHIAGRRLWSSAQIRAAR